MGSSQHRRPDGVGDSSPRSHELATRGVRADRVGAKLPRRATVLEGVGAIKEPRAPVPRPLTRDLSAGRAPPRLQTENRLVEDSAATHDKSYADGRPLAWCAGFGRFDRSWSWIAFDCRSRQTTGGLWRARANTPRTSDQGLAVPCESIGPVNARRKPGLGGKAGGSVAGSHLIERVLRKRGCSREHLSRKGALGRGVRVSLTRSRRKRSWCSENRPGLLGACGVRQKASEV
jgi:hypothetical protein